MLADEDSTPQPSQAAKDSVMKIRLNRANTTARKTGKHFVITQAEGSLKNYILTVWHNRHEWFAPRWENDMIQTGERVKVFASQSSAYRYMDSNCGPRGFYTLKQVTVR